LPIVCAIAIASPRVAAADGTGVIAIGADRARVAAAMAGGMSGRIVEDAVGQARAAIAAGAVPIETMVRFRHVREQIDEGWKAYKLVELAFAASRLASARTEAEGLVALPGGVELYAEATLKLGLVEVHPQLARADEGHAALVLALALDPDRPITLAEFSPDELAGIEAARAEPRATAKVHIAIDPPGAMVSVDGKDLGPGPVDTELARGQHVAVARAGLHHPVAQAFAVDLPRTLALSLEGDDEATKLATGAVAGMAEAPAAELVDAAIRYADLDQIAVVAEVAGRLRVQRCAGAPIACSAVVEVGFTDPASLGQAARSAWQAVQTGELRYPPSVFGDRVAPPHRWCEACRNPYVLGGVGAAIVVGTIVIIAVTQASRPSPTIGIDPGQFSR
jgi:hypothetical protein